MEPSLGDHQPGVGGPAARVKEPSITSVTRWTLAATATLLLALPTASAPQAPPDLTGLWAARARFGPDIRGTLTLFRGGGGWHADIAGLSVPVRVDGQQFSFELPDGKGRFRGRSTGRHIVGQWIEQVSQTSGTAYATPLVLEANGPGRWRGVVTPRDDAFTFFMPVTPQGDGTYATYLRNPERNVGRFIPVSRIELKGEVVTLIDRSSGRDTVRVEGRYDEGVIRIPLRGTSFDFRKIDGDSSSPF
jgi:hypothetical protein